MVTSPRDDGFGPLPGVSCRRPMGKEFEGQLHIAVGVVQGAPEDAPHEVAAGVQGLHQAFERYQGSTPSRCSSMKSGSGSSRSLAYSLMPSCQEGLFRLGIGETPRV